MPNYAAFLLAFPRAPRGSVSVQVWGIACATVVVMVGKAGASGWLLLNSRRGGRREGVKMGGDSGGGKGMGEGRKEL